MNTRKVKTISKGGELALTEVAKIKGFCSNNRPESEFIKEIVKDILAKFTSNMFSLFLIS